jgi:ribose transport system substrate-binding protein
MRRITGLLLAVLILTALILSGCGKKKAKWVIGMSQCNLGEPWREQMNTDISNAAKKHPEIKVIFKDAQNDTLRQQNQVQEFISAQVNLIIVSPKEAAPLTQVVAEAYQKGIPVIILDRRVLGDQYTCFIGADNKKIGMAAGKWIVEALGGNKTAIPAFERVLKIQKSR